MSERGVPGALSVGVKLSYGVGQAAEGLKNACFAVFLFFYYTAVLGVAPTLVGTALLIALLFDAITDPLAGYLSDRWHSRWGRRHPFMLAAALPLGLAFYLLFAPPDLSDQGLFVWLVVFTVLTRGAMTLFHVPHLSLGAELSPHFYERTTVVAYRYFFSYVGQFAAYALGFGYFLAANEEFANGQFNEAAYSPFALSMSVLMVISILITSIGTRSRIPHLPQPKHVIDNFSISYLFRQLYADFALALSNRSFRWLFSGVLVVFVMVGVDQALDLHMNTYFWELSSKDNFLFFAAAPVGILIGTLIARQLNIWFDKKPSIMLGTGWWAACQIVPVVLRLLDWFPENGTDTLLYTLVAVKFLQGFGVAQSLVTFNSMVPDIVDEQELKTGERQEGVFFAAVSFAGKATTGLGNFFAGFALAAIGWPSDAGRTAADIAPETIDWLGIVYGPIVAGFVVVCLWCYSKHQLNAQRHAQIVQELEARRANQLGPQSGSVTSLT